MIHRIPDCGFARSYIIEEENGLMVVDVGSIGAAQEIEAYCTQILNRPLRDIRIIAATHFHIDHIGGIGTLLNKCSPETKVMFHPLVQEYLDGTQELSPIKNWLSGLLPTMVHSIAGVRKLSHVGFENTAGIPLSVFRDYRYLPYEDHIRYFDSGRFPSYRLGFGNWEVVATPGHTEDSISLFNGDTRELICGDLIIGGNDGTGYLNRFHYDSEVICKSYWRVRDLMPKVIYPGHGGIVRRALDAMRLPLTPGSTGLLSPFPYR